MIGGLRENNMLVVSGHISNYLKILSLQTADIDDLSFCGLAGSTGRRFVAERSYSCQLGCVVSSPVGGRPACRLIRTGCGQPQVLTDSAGDMAFLPCGLFQGATYSSLPLEWRTGGSEREKQGAQNRGHHLAHSQKRRLTNSPCSIHNNCDHMCRPCARGGDYRGHRCHGTGITRSHATSCYSSEPCR